MCAQSAHVCNLDCVHTATLQVPDLRMFWDSDLRFLEQWPTDIQSLKDAVREGSLGGPEDE